MAVSFHQLAILPILVRNADIEEAACVGAEVYGKFLYLPLNFAVKLKLFFKNEYIKKYSVWMILDRSCRAGASLVAQW